MKRRNSGGIEVQAYRVGEGQRVRLKDWPTEVKSFYRSKAEYRRLLHERVEEISRLQGVLYADHRYALLLMFQAMDAAGKDGVIKHVLSGVNPQGCQVHSFKQPSVEELDHDFLWRAIKRLPERGRIGVFNRSYYEEVLVVRVHPEWLQKQNLPEELLIEPGSIWAARYRSIVDLERHLVTNGTRVVKFFLHLSKEEQRKRFLKRIDEPEKNWKMNLGDVKEREFWNQHMEAYQECLAATSTGTAPWYILPADDKQNARLIAAEIIRQELESLPLRFPKMDSAQREELRRVRKVLAP
jgi:PPK2 family polyphosphate:nucleotide phosphotransferase